MPRTDDRLPLDLTVVSGYKSPRCRFGNRRRDLAPTDDHDLVMLTAF